MGRIRLGVLAFASVMCVALGAVVSADEDAPLDRAKSLYRSAAYDEALGILDGLATEDSALNLEVAEYRLFCLVALDRKDDARTAVTTIVTANPFYQLSETQASPRVRAVFKEVRQTLLPTLVQRVYADAKASFDKKEPNVAAEFERVLTLLRDPDLTATKELTDLAVVAAAFRDLSAARDAAAAPPKPPAPSPADVANAANAAARARPAEPLVYRDGDPSVIAPVTLSQTMPTAALPERRIWTGAVELLIDETGKVLSARMATPIHGTYDRQLVQAALGWKYRPAMKDGVPARYLKVVNVRIDSRPPCTSFASDQCRPSN